MCKKKAIERLETVVSRVNDTFGVDLHADQLARMPYPTTPNTVISGQLKVQFLPNGLQNYGVQVEHGESTVLVDNTVEELLDMVDADRTESRIEGMRGIGEIGPRIELIREALVELLGLYAPAPALTLPEVKIPTSQSWSQLDLFATQKPVTTAA